MIPRGKVKRGDTPVAVVYHRSSVVFNNYGYGPLWPKMVVHFDGHGMPLPVNPGTHTNIWYEKWHLRMRM